ncbi:hypothetical protein PR048_002425 [Dryococelus australis]|uniref:Transposase n=1 Tax=Dryococelus australis TaxID=614101 RepID=A0ABQ9IK62_9NEOP|nr:hypothetical protein PR048_002425 [Dryococelus australis]
MELFMRALMVKYKVWNKRGKVWNKRGKVWNKRGKVWNKRGKVWNKRGSGVRCSIMASSSTSCNKNFTLRAVSATGKSEQTLSKIRKEGKLAHVSDENWLKPWNKQVKNAKNISLDDFDFAVIRRTDIHGDSSPFLLQPFHKLSSGFWPRLTSPHPAIQFVLNMFYGVEFGALGGPVQSANIVVGVPLVASGLFVFVQASCPLKINVYPDKPFKLRSISHPWRLIVWSYRCRNVLVVAVASLSAARDAANLLDRYEEVFCGEKVFIKECYSLALVRKTHVRTPLSTLLTLQDLSFEVLRHPPYSSDLAPSDFRLFATLKATLRGRRLNSDNDQVSYQALIGGSPSSMLAGKRRHIVGACAWSSRYKRLILSPILQRMSVDSEGNERHAKLHLDGFISAWVLTQPDRQTPYKELPSIYP